MYILGINGRPQTKVKRVKGHGGSHNAAACLLRDGELLAFVEEERFTHVKQDGSFPINSIHYCLDHAGISIEEVDHIATGWLSFREIFWERVRYFTKSGLVLKAPTYCAGMTYFALRDWMAGDIQGAFRRHFPKTSFREETFRFVPHHLAHAASTFRASGYEDAAILTLDGAGETTATMLALGRGNDIIVREEFKLPDSLGFCYSGFTEYLGFEKNNDEYKVMGLASYGRPDCKVDDIMQLREDGDYRIAVDFIFHFSALRRRYDYTWLSKRFGPARSNDNEPVTDKQKDIAASIQRQLERAGAGLARRIMADSGDDHLCLAGGVALNCKMNKVIREENGISEVYIQPAAADMGVALGAALEVHAQLGNCSKFRMSHAYWGPEYSDDEIRATLDSHELSYVRSADVSKEAAAHIADNRVVGWFQGRMEVGPRALGNRSILANPCTPGMNDVVNEKIKFREKWRPFCPSMLDEVKEQYLEKSYESPFMNLTFTVKEEMRRYIPAVVHVDGTARPQTVTEEINPRYYRLIEELGRLTGHSVVLNTSFNIKGDTIVNTPDDAVRTFLNTDMDVLVIGDYVVKKTGVGG
jgi:carbamoyltransferase